MHPAPPATQPAGMDVNAVVSYNVRAIRERRGMTQQAVADRLAQLTGHQLPQASISAMERGFDAGAGSTRTSCTCSRMCSTLGHVKVTQVRVVPTADDALPCDLDFLGGDDGTRTHDPLLAKTAGAAC